MANIEKIKGQASYSIGEMIEKSFARREGYKEKVQEFKFTLGMCLALVTSDLALSVHPNVEIPEEDLQIVRHFLEKIFSKNRYTGLQFLITRTLLYLNFRKIDAIRNVHPSLDLGCEVGFTSSLIFENPFSYGIDINPDYGPDAKASGMYNEYILGSAEKIPLPDESLKTIVMNNTMYHANNSEAILRECFRVLQPGGNLYFDELTPRIFDLNNRPFINYINNLGLAGVVSNFLSERAEVYIDKNTINPFKIKTIDQYKLLLQQCGFDLVSANSFMSPRLTSIAYAIHDIEHIFKFNVSDQAP